MWVDEAEFTVQFLEFHIEGKGVWKEGVVHTGLAPEECAPTSEEHVLDFRKLEQ